MDELVLFSRDDVVASINPEKLFQKMLFSVIGVFLIECAWGSLDVNETEIQMYVVSFNIHIVGLYKEVLSLSHTEGPEF